MLARRLAGQPTHRKPQGSGDRTRLPERHADRPAFATEQEGHRRGERAQLQLVEVDDPG
jgi:hypothetical protein